MQKIRNVTNMKTAPVILRGMFRFNQNNLMVCCLNIVFIQCQLEFIKRMTFQRMFLYFSNIHILNKIQQFVNKFYSRRHRLTGCRITCTAIIPRRFHTNLLHNGKMKWLFNLRSSEVDITKQKHISQRLPFVFLQCF